MNEFLKRQFKMLDFVQSPEGEELIQQNTWFVLDVINKAIEKGADPDEAIHTAFETWWDLMPYNDAVPDKQKEEIIQNIIKFWHDNYD